MRKFGIIGFPLVHSFSKGYFQMKFAREGLKDCSFENFEIEKLTKLPLGLSGFSVTIPHKQSVIPLLKRIDAAAREVGAVNCVDKNLTGYNTDIIGFERSLLQLIGEERPEALVLGSGGAAKAVVYVLQRLGINYLQVSRNGELRYSNLPNLLISQRRLIINATPVGTFPKIDESPQIPYDAIEKGHYLYDLVYNPCETQFLREGRIRGACVKNGAQMLRLQAEAAWEIWNREI